MLSEQQRTKSNFPVRDAREDELTRSTPASRPSNGDHKGGSNDQHAETSNQGLIADRWQLLEHIGEGGMSDVYKARHVLMNKIGAVKFLKGNLSTDPIAVKRFQQEALACGQLAHPNIVQTYDCGLSERGFYLILEYLEGTSLADILDDLSKHAPDGHGKLAIKDAVPIFKQVCDSLDHAHRKGIVHRDIKPSNVMLAYAEGHPENTAVKIVDFGIAKLIGQGNPGTTDGSLTLTGEVFGSPLYMSPEQCMGQSVDGRSDVYSIGCLMYETLVGNRAVIGNSPTETMMKHVHDVPDISALRDIDDPAAAAMEKIIALCLEKEPGKRYQTMAQLKADLESLPLADEVLPVKVDSQASLFIFGMSVLAILVTTIMALAIYYLLPFQESEAVNENLTRPLSPPPYHLQLSAADNLKNLSMVPVDLLRRFQASILAAERAFSEKHFALAGKNYQAAADQIIKSSLTNGRQSLLAEAFCGYAQAAYFAHINPASESQINLDDVEYKLTSVLRDASKDSQSEKSTLSEKELEEVNQWKARLQFAQRNYSGALSSIEEMLIHGDSEDLDRARWMACEADLKRLVSEGSESREECVPIFQKAIDLLTKLKCDDQKLLADINYRLGITLLELKNKNYAAAGQAFREAAAHYHRAARSANTRDRKSLEENATAAKRKVFETTKEFDSFAALFYKVQNGV